MLIISAQLSDTGPITCVARNRSGEAVAQVQILKKHLPLGIIVFFSFVR